MGYTIAQKIIKNHLLSGEMVTGWAVRGGKTYYLDTDAANYGVMVTGTVTINSSKCTFDANGTLVSINDQKVDPGVIPTL